MLASILIAISAAIGFAMGTGHLYLTYFSKAFAPRDNDVLEKLKSVSPRITPNTTMWKMLTGFNVSHSMGVMLYGAIYAYLALAQPALLFHSPFLLAVGGITLLTYVGLAIRYWFEAPLIGVSIALVFYIAGVIAAVVIA